MKTGFIFINRRGKCLSICLLEKHTGRISIPNWVDLNDAEVFSTDDIQSVERMHRSSNLDLTDVVRAIPVEVTRIVNFIKEKNNE